MPFKIITVKGGFKVKNTDSKKVYKKTNWKYDNDRKPIYSFKPFPYRTPPKKLENLLYMNVYMNKFSLSGYFAEILITYMEEYKKRDFYNDYHLYE